MTLSFIIISLYLATTSSAISYGGLSRAELEQKLNKLYKFATKGERTLTPNTVTSREHSGVPMDEARPALLLELGFLSLENSFCDIAQDCLQQVPKEELLQGAPKLYLLRDLLSTQLLVARQDDVYTTAAVQSRIKTLDHLEQLLASALRIPDPDIVQVGVAVSSLK